MSWWVAALAVAGVALGVQLERQPPIENPHPARLRRKWASYANTIAKGPRRGDIDIDVDPDTSGADLVTWLYWYFGGGSVKGGRDHRFRERDRPHRGHRRS